MPPPVPTVVRLRIESLFGGAAAGPVLETPAVVNTGYRAWARDLSLPGEAARELRFWPKLPPSAVPMKVLAYAGKVDVWGIPDAVRVRVLTADRQGPDVVANVAVNPRGDELLISNALAGGLGLVLLDPERGLWRFRDDPPDRERTSESPRFWPPARGRRRGGPSGGRRGRRGRT